ncbi:hypothetical protein N7468_002468 [Penicillium chermesinum]|uniref:NAD-dependent epimerase/dehydratase domain-containing protein n=1 Tax=Penicillium chermesinum TaxID=63820 RepID=A0A9W9PIQ2_9EURO|nr:uncharacterized protein N7468_002468 [Penicillium chermesinum]KAJ5247485.1 hypothetical protein N7468_002468 [Penicillium chermesinum]KAJ6145724.1 hypothetical protein N7470_009619 [Penicillium chermesinum]
MRVFVTGASGFVGQAVVQELLGAGHTVLALARSDASAEALQSKGVDVLRGSIEDTESLKRGASEADGVIHLAFNHDFTRFDDSAAEELQALLAMGSVLAGTNKPLVFTGGTLSLPKGTVSDEDTPADSTSFLAARTLTESKALALAAQGVRISLIRLSPTTHDENDKGFLNIMTQFAIGKGESIYIGDGLNRWTAVHRADAAKLYRLALDKGVAGSIYHAIGEEGVRLKDIAEAIGQASGVPTVSKTFEEALKHFEGFMAYPVSFDAPATSKKTQERLGWKPTGRTVVEEIQAGVYNSPAAA